MIFLLRAILAIKNIKGTAATPLSTMNQINYKEDSDSSDCQKQDVNLYRKGMMK